MGVLVKVETCTSALGSPLLPPRGLLERHLDSENRFSVLGQGCLAKPKNLVWLSTTQTNWSFGTLRAFRTIFNLSWDKVKNKKKRRCLLDSPGTKDASQKWGSRGKCSFTATESKRFFGAHMSKGYGWLEPVCTRGKLQFVCLPDG